MIDPHLTDRLWRAGVNAVSLPDRRHRGRPAPIAVAALARRELGLECLVEYACRGQDIFEAISDLLGASLLGVRNLVVLGGEPSPLGPYGESGEPRDFDVADLVRIAAELNRGGGPGSEGGGAPTSFVAGVSFDPAAVDVARELRRLAECVEAGADFAVTPPVFEAGALAGLPSDAASVPVIAGIRLLSGLRDAELLADELPGPSPPVRLVERMRRARSLGGAGRERAEGLAIACETMEELEGLVRGFQLSAAPGETASILELIEG